MRGIVDVEKRSSARKLENEQKLRHIHSHNKLSCFQKKKKWDSSSLHIPPSTMCHSSQHLSPNACQMFIFTARCWSDSRNVILTRHTPSKDGPWSESCQEQALWVAWWERAGDRRASLATEGSPGEPAAETPALGGDTRGPRTHSPNKPAANMKGPAWVTFHGLESATLLAFRELWSMEGSSYPRRKSKPKKWEDSKISQNRALPFLNLWMRLIRTQYLFQT